MMGVGKGHLMCLWGNWEWTQIWCLPWCQGWMGGIHLTRFTERSLPVWPKTSYIILHHIKWKRPQLWDVLPRVDSLMRAGSKEGPDAYSQTTSFFSGSMLRLVSKSSSLAYALEFVSAEAAWCLSATQSRMLNYWWKMILKIASGSFGLREVCILRSKREQR